MLLIEDNPGDVLLEKEALRSRGLDIEIKLHTDGEQVLNFITASDRGEVTFQPDVVLLDLNLPRAHGEQVLDRIRHSRTLAQVPVLVVTSSDSQRDRAAAARLGANGYFRKPADYDEFMKLGEVVEAMLAT